MYSTHIRHLDFFHITRVSYLMMSDAQSPIIKHAYHSNKRSSGRKIEKVSALSIRYLSPLFPGLHLFIQSPKPSRISSFTLCISFEIFLVQSALSLQFYMYLLTVLSILLLATNLSLQFSSKNLEFF